MKMATLLSGPVASGKSMIADALKARLDHCGMQCVCVELDARKLLGPFNTLANRQSLKYEMTKGDVELILVAVDPDMDEVKELCRYLGISLVRHVVTNTFDGWSGHNLGAK